MPPALTAGDVSASMVCGRLCAQSVAWTKSSNGGHLVYLSNGPVLLIRAEEERVLFGFWRGQRLRTIEPRLKPGGKYEMATLELREAMSIDAATVKRLVRDAVALNESLGNPTILPPKGDE
jgi:hypothetical protein